MEEEKEITGTIMAYGATGGTIEMPFTIPVTEDSIRAVKCTNGDCKLALGYIELIIPQEAKQALKAELDRV